MRILVCAAEAPLSPLNGFRLQLIPVCAGLAERGHEVCVLAYRRERQHGDPPPGVELQLIDYPELGLFASGARWLARSQPLGVITGERAIARAARSLVAEREFDVAHVAGWPLAGIRPALQPLPAILTTLDAWHVNYAARRDAASRLARPALAQEVRRIARFEASSYRTFDSVVVVSNEDAAALRRLDPAVRVHTVPNGVDTERFSPGPPESREPSLVVMTGAMHWAPNVAAARYLVESVLPALRKRVPHARVALVGRDPTSELVELGEEKGVVVTGEVPEMTGWLQRADAYACPMVNGTGIKNKLLEAMACACACVATPIACQGLDVESGREIVIAEDTEAFAAALAEVMADGDLARRLGAAARDRVVADHGWDAVVDTYETLLSRAIGDQQRAAGPARADAPSN